MTIFASPIATTAKNAKDAYAKVQAYRELYNIVNSELLTYVTGVFYDAQGDCCFLSGYSRLVTISARSIKWFDVACGKEVTIIPADGSFELTLRV